MHSSLKRESPAPAAREAQDVLILSSSLLIDRMLVHTDFLRTLGERSARVRVWAASADNPAYREFWRRQPAEVRPLPRIRAFRQLLHNYPRRLNEALWDYRQKEPSRLSMMRHRPIPEENRARRLIDRIARALATVGVEGQVESLLEWWLLRYERSEEATELLRGDPPDVMLTTGPFQFEQPAIAAAALRLGVRTLALIPSWDNISTKKRMIFKYDGYVVWSNKMRDELHDRYPHTRKVPVYVVGAPQFDVFFQPRFRQSRDDFCASQRLDPALPIIVYAVGSPNFLKGEPYGAIALAEAIAEEKLTGVQLLVRPHPIHDHGKLEEMFRGFGDSVRVQRTSTPGTPVHERSQDESQIREWVNTFRHAAVVVNIVSTVSVDAALCDRPVVALDFDPSPARADQQLIREINHEWTHFSPIAESGGVWLVKDVPEMLHAVRSYLDNPELHREKRRWISRFVCEFPDGRCGARLAIAVLEFASAASFVAGG